MRGTITQPDSYGLQARISYAGKEYSKYFAFSAHTRQGARKEARRWLARMDTELPKRLPYREELQANNTSGVVGVSRSVYYDKRRAAYYVKYQTLWHDGQSPRIKSFWVGNLLTLDPTLEEAAFTQAVAFRKAYEQAAAVEAPFNPDDWANWRDDYFNGTNHFTA